MASIPQITALGADGTVRSPVANSSGYIRIPAHELVRREFCADNPVGTLINDLVRDIAQRIGRSAGAITPALKRLQNDGWISYLADAHGMLIEVLRSDLGAPTLDQVPDRVDASAAQPIDPESAAQWDAPPRALDQVPDRENTALGCDQVHDRSACMVDPVKDLNSSSNMRESPGKNDWAALTIDGADFIPIAALEKAGHTPESVAAADVKIQTRREYPRSEQVKILFRCLLTNQPIISAAEIAARVSEERHDVRPERATPRNPENHGSDRPRQRDRSQDSSGIRAVARRFRREDYRGYVNE